MEIFLRTARALHFPKYRIPPHEPRSHPRAQSPTAAHQAAIPVLDLRDSFLLSVYTVFFWSNFNASQFWDRHATADGMIVETRVVIDRVADYRYGGAILYRLDAHVKFKADGQDQDRWLRVQTGTTSRLELMAKAATDPKTCLVYWTPGHLENARCKMDLY